jgi:NAD(P)-dependent dehydrogenase (short-subunit alcohol dehydrogenase family)
MATYDVAHRSAIVTGAGSGIGRAVALELAANGASVIVADLVEAPLTTLLEEVRAAGGTAEMIVGDVSDPDFAIACVADANALAPLRIAVNNAGIGGEQSLIGDYSLDGWRKVIE